MRIKKMIHQKENALISQLISQRNVWRSVWLTDRTRIPLTAAHNIFIYSFLRGFKRAYKLRGLYPVWLMIGIGEKY